MQRCTVRYFELSFLKPLFSAKSQ